MTKQVFVTSAQKMAAQAVVRRSAARGKPVSSSVTKIANASHQITARTPGQTKSAAKAVTR
jgi:hypothetical protein